MTGPTTTGRDRVEIPEGFFDEVASLLATESAEEVAEIVIAVCISRGILHPELDEDPSDELRAEQIFEVFSLLDAVTAAVSDGRIVPSAVPVAEEMDPEMAALWYGFVADAEDPEAAAAVASMIETGQPVQL